MLQRLATALCVGAIVAACSSGGPGTPINPGPSTDRAAGGPESAGSGPEGASSSGDPGGCIPCSGFYQCVGAIQGQDITGGATLVSNSPGCPANPNKKDDGIYLACGGSIISGANVSGLPPSSVVGKWTDVGGGVLIACVRVDGMDDCITCTPATEPMNTPGGGNRNDGGTSSLGDAG